MYLKGKLSAEKARVDIWKDKSQASCPSAAHDRLSSKQGFTSACVVPVGKPTTLVRAAMQFGWQYTQRTCSCEISH